MTRGSSGSIFAEYHRAAVRFSPAAGLPPPDHILAHAGHTFTQGKPNFYILSEEDISYVNITVSCRFVLDRDLQENIKKDKPVCRFSDYHRYLVKYVVKHKSAKLL